MNKGIIMEIKRDILVMLTPEGEFVKGKRQPNQQYSLGEEIPFFPLVEERKMKKMVTNWNWKVSTPLVMACILILTLISSAVIPNNEAYAYISVDINPSVELTVNKDQQVISIEPYNEDGIKLLEHLPDWSQESLSEVTKDIIHESERLGYLKEGQNILITSSLINEEGNKDESTIMNSLNNLVEEYSSKYKANITVKETTKDIREKATKKGMTAGSLLRETENVQKSDSKAVEDKKESKVVNDKKENKTLNEEEEPAVESNSQGQSHSTDNKEKSKSVDPKQNYGQSKKAQNSHPNQQSEDKSKSSQNQEDKDSGNNHSNRDNHGNHEGHNKSNTEKKQNGAEKNNVKKEYKNTNENKKYNNHSENSKKQKD